MCCRILFLRYTFKLIIILVFFENKPVIMTRFLLIISILLIAAGCASKRNVKKAAKFEEAGLYQDAAEYYYTAVKKKASNVDAKLGLRKTGQQTLDKKLSDFNIAYKQADYQKSVYNYLDAENYYNKIKGVGVELSFPEYYKEYYEEAKGDYLNKKYIDGLDKLNRDEFSAALTVFEEIRTIDANYKDIKDQIIIARYEPIYRDANQYLNNKLYRKAYYAFDNIIKGAGTYKQSVTLKEDALNKGTITVLVTDFNFSTFINKSASLAVTSRLKSQLGKSDNPFLKIIDQSAVNRDIYENGKMNLKAANLAGIKSVLVGEIIKASESKGKPKRTEKRGYIKEIKKVKNEKGEEIEKPEYHKTTYYEIEGENRATLELTFKLISTENNEILISDNINITRTDDLHYATFSGEKNKLIPGYWKSLDRKSPEDVIKDNSRDVGNLRDLLNNKQEMKSTSELLNEAYNQAVQQIYKKVTSYNPEQ